MSCMKINSSTVHNIFELVTKRIHEISTQSKRHPSENLEDESSSLALIRNYGILCPFEIFMVLLERPAILI